MKVNTISLRRYQDVKIWVWPIFSFFMINFLRPHIPIKKKNINGVMSSPTQNMDSFDTAFFCVNDRQINIKKKIEYALFYAGNSWYSCCVALRLIIYTTTHLSTCTREGTHGRYEPPLCRHEPPRFARQTEPQLCRNKHALYNKMCLAVYYRRFFFNLFFFMLKWYIKL